ncbi:GGDEF domain-containing protein [Stomatobaculum longum]|uniref:GGDEF domain-containing protein n=1 Tax=Stomatobaculum longum TaxID=796942 RepID=UPI0028ECE58D|nr:GGDEF domain-containing protein [Stomatobaculum longum]
MRRAAHADAFLKVKNRNAMEAHRRALMKRNAPRSVGVVYLDLNGLKQTNDRYGHKAGDRLLQRAVDFFAAYFPREHIYRAGGDEFVILESGLQEASFSVRVRNLRKALKAHTAPQAAMGAAWRAREGLIQEALDEADAEMYRDKNGAGRFRGTKKQKQI